MKGVITIEVLMHTEHTERLSELGIATNLEDCEIEPKTFFRIDSMQATDEGYTVFEVGETGYMTKEPFNQLLWRIKESFGL